MKTLLAAFGVLVAVLLALMVLSGGVARAALHLHWFSHSMLWLCGVAALAGLAFWVARRRG